MYAGNRLSTTLRKYLIPTQQIHYIRAPSHDYKAGYLRLVIVYLLSPASYLQQSSNQTHMAIYQALLNRKITLLLALRLLLMQCFPLNCRPYPEGGREGGNREVESHCYVTLSTRPTDLSYHIITAV